MPGMTSTVASTGGQMHTMGAPEVVGGNSNEMGVSITSTGETTTSGSSGSGLETSIDVESTSTIDSHLDSFFATHAITREDVMVVAASIQLVMWVSLLYLEVSKR